MRIGKSTRQRVGEAVQWIEGRPRNMLDPKATRGSGIRLPVVIRVVNQVPAMAGSTPGKGAGKIQNFNGTSFTDGTSDNVDLYNLLDKQVKAGGYVKAIVMYGKFFLLDPSCKDAA